MMGMHLYCIVAAGQAPSRGLRGLDGVRVEGVSAGGLSVWCSAAARRPVVELERVRAHDRVVRAACARVTPLPFRFGQWFPDTDRLEAWLLAGRERYREGLATVSGALEFALRLDPAVAPREAREEAVAAVRPLGESTERGAGSAYLRTLARREAVRAERDRRGEEILSALATRLDGLVRAAAPDAPPVEGSLASVGHLVPRSGFEPYRRAVERFARERTELTVRLTGPWPPYSFVRVPPS